MPSPQMIFGNMLDATASLEASPQDSTITGPYFEDMKFNEVQATTKLKSRC